MAAERVTAVISTYQRRLTAMPFIPGTFLVPFHDTTVDTFTAVIIDWIETGTTVISDCWAAYLYLDTT
jgi:hypothetical protein